MEKSGMTGSPMEAVSEYPEDFDEFTNPPTEVSPMSIIIVGGLRICCTRQLQWGMVHASYNGG